ncbi:MAG: NUDIX domain-containing protein [Bacteroidales bacterium]|nr:NUDIX domain-containing protein [Bacteroidales bacterium]
MNNFIVFYKFNFIAFATKKENLPEYVTNQPNDVFEDDTNIKGIIEWFIHDDTEKNVVVICPNGVKKAIKELLNFFTLIKAGGGIVRNPKDKYLVIRRNERWDLPKGKAEAGETLEETSLREVEEETGVHDIIADKLIVKTYHIYYMFEKWILKQTSWYDMHINDLQNTTPQIEEGIELTEWVAKDEVHHRLNNSYAMLAFLANTWMKKE